MSALSTTRTLLSYNLLPALVISTAVIFGSGITRPTPTSIFLAIAAIVMLMIEASNQQFRVRSTSFATRVIWQHAPLRIIFSVLAVFSAIVLYLAFPRLAQSPMLFAVAAMLIFAVETSLFEAGIKHTRRPMASSWNTRLKRIAQLYMKIHGKEFYGSEEITTPLGLLWFFDALGTHILAIGYFFSIAWSTWHHYSCPYQASIKTWFICSQQAFLSCTMVAFIALSYHLSRRGAKINLYIAEKLFPQGRIPDQWVGPRDPSAITITILIFFANYAILAWISDNIRLASAFMLVTACIDFNTTRLIASRTITFLTDRKYVPRLDDQDYTLVCERRRVIRDYLSKPHLRKEAFRVGACALTFVFAMSGARVVAYLLLISTLVLNEVIASRWQSERNHALMSIEKALK